MEELTKKYVINGPNNVARLTDGKKILYIFGDVHFDERYQNECELNDDYDSIDIDKLLFKFMKNEKNREFDLFIECDNKNFIPEKNNISRQKYIYQINKLVKSNIDIKNNKIIINKKYSNFRFHYFDIRSNLYLDDKLWNYIHKYNSYYYPYSILTCKIIIEDSNNIINLLNKYYDYLINDYKNNKELDKLLNIYENNNIKKIINKLFNNYVLKNIKFTIDNYKKLINFITKSIDDLQNKFIDELKKIKILSYIELELEKNIDYLVSINVILTDLYFLRIFLDKKYIKNTIVYCGSDHMFDYIYFLTKYFNFKMTNIYYKDKSYKLDKIDTTNISYFKEYKKYLINYNKNLEFNQCVDLIDFPINFS